MSLTKFAQSATQPITATQTRAILKEMGSAVQLLRTSYDKASGYSDALGLRTDVA